MDVYANQAGALYATIILSVIAIPAIFQVGRLSSNRFENFEPQVCYNKPANTDKTDKWCIVRGHRGHSPD